MKDIADDGKPFWAWWEFTERSLSKSGYEPEDETKERSRDKASRQARHQTRDFRKMLSTHRNESSQRQRRRQDIVENTTE